MKAIASMDLNRVIGNKGSIPWRIPEDMKWFKSFTMGKTLVMGRKTFESLPPLKGRNIIVLGNNFGPIVDYYQSNIHKCDHLYLRIPASFSLIADLTNGWPDAIVAGGAKTYEVLLPHCNEVYLTLVLDEYEGDTYMPEFESQFPNIETIKEAKNYWIIRYWK